MVLLKDGRVFAWGDGTYGELGLGAKVCMIDEPQEIKYFRHQRIKVRKVTAGGRHSICLDKHGIVYAFGFNNTTDKMAARIYTPMPFESLPFKVKDIVTGSGHTSCVSKDGFAYTWEGCFGKRNEIDEVGGRPI